MIAWLQPVALVGLAAIAGPVIVHLLRRHQARRVVVPSVRFVRPSEDAAVKMRRLTDGWLLLVRAAIVACAVLALAGPLLLTDARRARWSARTVRAVVVDASPSARPNIERTRVQSEVDSASLAEVIDTADLAAGVKRAVAWLGESLPAQREVVVVSDFQAGAIDASDLDAVPPEVGLRFVRVASTAVSRETNTADVLDGERRLTPRLALDDEHSTLSYAESGAPIAGLDLRAAPRDAAKVAALVRIVGEAGAVAPSVEQPIVIRFPGAERDAADDVDGPDWIDDAARRLLASRDIAEAGVRVSSARGALVVDVDVDPGSLEAARVLKAALDARLAAGEFLELEPRVLDDRTLASWSRPPGAADPSAWRRTDGSDGRWLWAAALALLALEAFVRRQAAPVVPVKEQHAA